MRVFSMNIEFNINLFIVSTRSLAFLMTPLTTSFIQTYLANSCLPCLSLLQLLIQLLLEVHDVQPGGGAGGDPLPPELPIVFPLSRRKDGVEQLLAGLAVLVNQHRVLNVHHLRVLELDQGEGCQGWVLIIGATGAAL